MKKVAIVAMALMCATATISAQSTSIKGNGPQLISQMNGQMAKRNTAVFEENKGQMKDQHWKPRPDVLFNGRAQGMNYYIRDNGMSYQLSRVESWKDEEDDRFSMKGSEIRQVPNELGTYRVDVQWTDFNADFTVETGVELDGYTNYYNVPEGVEPALSVKQYETVTLKELWPGIDLRCYSTDGTLETDWLVASGADYTQIRFEVRGAEMSTDDAGHLIMSTPFGEIREGTLKVFQGDALLEARWVIIPLAGEVPGGVVSFEVIGHDPMLAMRIDPLVRVWGTYYGGSSYEQGYYSCATDGSGNVYLAGETRSTNAISSGGHQNTFGGGQGGAAGDAFVVKFYGNGVRQWATYYGGYSSDQGTSCATDDSGNVYLAGVTSSTNSIASGGHQNTYGGGSRDAYLVKFNSSGVRQWGTYYGGSYDDFGGACATDISGNVYLAGNTISPNAIASDGHQDTLGGGTDAFLVKFNGSGVRQWATYYGGSSYDYGHSCAIDGSGNVYLAGETRSINAIASGGHQNTYGGDYGDAFLVKFNGSGVRQWGTYYGGDQHEIGRSCATDGNGNVYLAGQTTSTNAIASDGHQDTLGGGGNDAFLVKFNGIGVRQWATYYGGNGIDGGAFCATDESGNVYLAGSTQSTTAIAFNGHQDVYGGGGDAFLVKFNSNGGRQWGTYYGPSPTDQGYSCATDGNGNVYLAGYTSSPFDIASGGHQGTHGGGTWDAFLVKFNEMVTGVNDGGSLQPLLTVFPNPSNSIFNVVMENASGDVQLTVTDIMGREVQSERFTATDTTTRTIDLSGHANGVYSLQISTTQGVSGMKLVKE